MNDNSLYVTKSGAQKAPSLDPVAVAVALLEKELGAVNITWCAVCGEAFGPFTWRYIVTDCYGNSACVCVNQTCRTEVYALLSREGVTAVLT